MQIDLLEQHIIILFHLDDEFMLMLDKFELQLFPLFGMFLLDIFVLLLDVLLLHVVHALLFEFFHLSQLTPKI